MSTIDIRDDIPSTTEIRFSDRTGGYYSADTIRPVDNYTNGEYGVELRDSDSGRSLRVANKGHAAYLRKALDEAERLGWLK